MLRGMLEALASRGVASVVLTFNSKHVVAKVGGARSPACMHGAIYVPDIHMHVPWMSALLPAPPREAALGIQLGALLTSDARRAAPPGPRPPLRRPPPLLQGGRRPRGLRQRRLREEQGDLAGGEACPRRPRCWPSFSLLSLYSRRRARASLRLLGPT